MAKKSDEIELIPDAWERFERAFDVVAKSGPKHRNKSNPRRPTLSKDAVSHEGEDWQELGFDAGPETSEDRPLRPSRRQRTILSERRVVARYRKIEGGIELSFDPPLVSS